ncbi:MAG: ATP-dependent zinc protease family protein [Gammaproteobacteria bacterium]
MQIGWREWVELPGLGIPGIKAKIDTGARTSALHAFRLEEFEEQGQRHVRFRIYPLQHRTDLECECAAAIIDTRVVSDSGGHRERRPVIRTRIKLGPHEWFAEITLTNREDMLFRMLLGRTAITEGGLLINPALSYLGGPSLRYCYPRRKRISNRR